MISSICLQNFRSYHDKAVEFSPGVNIIVGPNASGKTNLLEAVIALARGNSFRAKDIDLISYDHAWARLDGSFDEAERGLKLKSDGLHLDKTFKINGQPFKRLNLERTVPIVYFEPEHLALITSGPTERRELIDELLSLTRADYKQLSASYRRTLAQRNALLKRGRGAAKQQLFAWDVRLGQLGSQIAGSRLGLVNQLNQELADVYSQIAKQPTAVELIYKTQFSLPSYASQMVARLARTLDQDLERGFTGSGPHREDLAFKISTQPISTSASRGEMRSLMLALKILELKLVEEARGQKPILLLDDVFSELDVTRRQALIKATQNYQTILTTTEADAASSYFKKAPPSIIRTKKLRS